jgi:hypothetical protein
MHEEKRQRMRGSLLLSTLLPVALAAFASGCAATSSEDVGSDESNLTEDEGQLARIYAAVKDVDQEHVVFAAGVKAPAVTAASGSKVEHASLYGVDWFQKWGGGRTADHEWATGTPEGQRCMWASVARFEAIMTDAPPELVAFLAEHTSWDGSFNNWNDDYAGKSPDGEAAYGNARGARLWASRNDLSKWVSATAKDGSCYLPTRKMVVAFASACKERAAANNGAIQGCEARGD